VYRFIEKPFIRLEKDSMLVAKGDPAALVCSATGIPPPAITWYKNNREVSCLPLVYVHYMSNICLVYVHYISGIWVILLNYLATFDCEPLGFFVTVRNPN